jgi:hypothetical protein
MGTERDACIFGDAKKKKKKCGFLRCNQLMELIDAIDLRWSQYMRWRNGRAVVERVVRNLVFDTHPWDLGMVQNLTPGWVT